MTKEKMNSKKPTKKRTYPPKTAKTPRGLNPKNHPGEQKTGPKTKSGKEASSLNALKHGLRSETVKQLRAALRAQKVWAKRIKHAGNL